MPLLSNQDIKEREIYTKVQIAVDNYDILHNPKVKKKYPLLYAAISEHDKHYVSSWYALTWEEFQEFEAYRYDTSIGYYG